MTTLVGPFMWTYHPPRTRGVYIIHHVSAVRCRRLLDDIRQGTWSLGQRRRNTP